MPRPSRYRPEFVTVIAERGIEAVAAAAGVTVDACYRWAIQRTPDGELRRPEFAAAYREAMKRKGVEHD